MAPAGVAPCASTMAAPRSTRRGTLAAPALLTPLSGRPTHPEGNPASVPGLPPPPVTGVFRQCRSPPPPDCVWLGRSAAPPAGTCSSFGSPSRKDPGQRTTRSHLTAELGETERSQTLYLSDGLASLPGLRTRNLPEGFSKGFPNRKVFSRGWSCGFLTKRRFSCLPQ